MALTNEHAEQLHEMNTRQLAATWNVMQFQVHAGVAGEHEREVAAYVADLMTARGCQSPQQGKLMAPARR